MFTDSVGNSLPVGERCESLFFEQREKIGALACRGFCNNVDLSELRAEPLEAGGGKQRALRLVGHGLCDAELRAALALAPC